MEQIISQTVGQLVFLLPLFFINAFLLIQSRFLLKIIKKDKFIFDFPISQKLFGSQKTIFGLIFTIIASILLYGHFFGLFFEGFVLGSGMFFGILCSSFIKRSLKKKPGDRFILDTFDFILGAQIFYFIFLGKLFDQLLLIILITMILHRGSNILAYKLKLKDNPW